MIEKWRQLKIDTKILVAGFIILGLLCFLLSSPAKDSATEAPSEPAASVDTFIPRGYTLVPVELANSASLSSMVGDVGGVVDLYLASTETRKGGLKIGARLKLLRAPLNPDQYAVLVNEQEAPKLLGYSGPFTAVIQNPDSRGSQLATTKKRTIQIDYQN
ncbi:MAG: hypothetical protein ACKOX6_04580 [Bdellovibrio sp.]